MIDLAISICLASLLIWAVVDIYFYSIVFEPVRQYAEGYTDAKTWFMRHFRYMLGCPFCFSHWVAAAVLLLLWLFGQCGILPLNIHFLSAVMFIPVAARLGMLIRDNTLPPMIFPGDSDEKEPAGSVS